MYRLITLLALLGASVEASPTAPDFIPIDSQYYVRINSTYLYVVEFTPPENPNITCSYSTGPNGIGYTCYSKYKEELPDEQN